MIGNNIPVFDAHPYPMQIMTAPPMVRGGGARPSFKKRSFNNSDRGGRSNHNASQQVYMTEELWSKIKNAKEDLTMLVNEAAAAMTPESTSLDLSKRIFELTLEKKFDPIALALIDLKQEIQQTF